MSEHGDLTRWNRAGLSRFQYIDGNAVHWLEMLRTELSRRFGQWDAMQVSPGSDKTEAGILADLLKQYQDERGDMLWQMVRTFSRSSHVLSETINTYANESYLRTATQWDNIRRMVEMLDYHPAPPASASTSLVLELKQAACGLVDAGFQVKYSPPDGGASIFFETLEDIELDAGLNTLRIKGYHAAVGSFSDNEDAGADLNALPIWIADEGMTGLSAGQIVVLTDGDHAVVDEIAVFCENTREVYLTHSEWHSCAKADTALLLLADDIRVPRLNGDNIVCFKQPHGLVAGDIIAWNQSTVWHYAEVIESDELVIRSSSPVPAVDIYRAYTITRNQDGEILFPLDGVYLSVSKHKNGIASRFHKTGVNHKGSAAYANKVSSPGIAAIYIVNGVDQVVGKASGIVHEYRFQGGPGGLASGQMVVIDVSENMRKALIIHSLNTFENDFTIAFTHPDGSDYEGEIKRLYACFKYKLMAQGYDRNETTLKDAGMLSSCPLASDLTSLSTLLTPNRRLIIEQQTEHGYTHALNAHLTSVDAVTGSISFKPALAADAGFTLGNTVIRANVVVAGHGKRQPERVLGSGDGTQSLQTFLFANEGVSFVADTSMANGVGADIELSVDGRIWQQVASLNDSEPSDSHFNLRMSEEGYIEIGFGDGEHGKRLPGGSNNLRIAWRKGSGQEGNVAAHALEKAVKPHRLLSGIRQPLAAAGGADMESSDFLRKNAPASVLALERAVSLDDFRHLAAGHSSVWQASASMLPSGSSRNRRVEVAVVPAGGGSLDDTLKTTLQHYLEQHAVPGCKVMVVGFERIPLLLEVVIQVNSDAFNAETVIADVRASLLNALSLENALLAQPLYLSRVYALVEAVNGVENALCLIVEGMQILNGEAGPLGDAHVGIGAGGMILRVDAAQRQLIYLDKDGSGLTLRTGGYVL